MAYVLMNTEIGSEADVLRDLRKVNGVAEAHNVVGIYDIIASIKADTMDDLAKIITNDLAIRKVHSKLTVILTET